MALICAASTLLPLMLKLLIETERPASKEESLKRKENVEREEPAYSKAKFEAEKEESTIKEDTTIPLINTSNVGASTLYDDEASKFIKNVPKVCPYNSSTLLLYAIKIR